MTIEQNKALQRRYLEASVSADQLQFKAMMSSDFVAHLPGGMQNLEGFLQQTGYFASTFSGHRMTVQDQIAEGDKVAARATWSATHTGNFQGLPATGKQIEIGAFVIERFRDDQVIEHWGLFDMLSMMRQLGLVPPT